MAETDYGVSGQVIAETYCALSRKSVPAMPIGEIDLWIEKLSKQPCVPVDPELVTRGIQISRRYRISYYDAALVAAAERLGADTLYTEDLNNGQRYDAVTALNPFL